MGVPTSARSPQRRALAWAIDAHLGSLRRKLGDLGDRVEKFHGVGYRLREESP
ncbi:MAG: helix-turn-helix domain-containing protein [Planctomycetes bacterium]|nr:helix-turn-helix domain-containing protein [Planctomycetota bacterium]